MRMGELPETERVRAIYAFVRNEILFGYNVDDGIRAFPRRFE